MVKEHTRHPIKSERLVIDIQGEIIEIGFPNLSGDTRYSTFQELVVGKLTGQIVWKAIILTSNE